MMNIFIMLAIIIANGIALALIYQFVKKMPKKEKIIFIAASFAINYMLILIVYALSGIGMDATINESSKNFITYVFVPVNVILFVPFIAHAYIKVKEKKIKPENFVKRLVAILVIALIVLVMEFFYFRNVQENIQVINQEKEKQEVQNTQNNQAINEVENLISNNIEEKNNQINENQIDNSIMVNTTNTANTNVQ